MICFPHGNRRRASCVDRRDVSDVALNYGCRGQFSEERRQHMEDGAKLSRALIMPFPIRAGRRLNARVRVWSSPRKIPVVARAPRILSSYLRTSNYSSAHLTRMNDIVKVSSSATGLARGVAGDRGVGPVKKAKNGCGTRIRSGLHPDVTR